jgi:hypothetical protein
MHLNWHTWVHYNTDLFCSSDEYTIGHLIKTEWNYTESIAIKLDW